jgi:threonine synthase
VVPTGNFGNILACYYAMKAGLPVSKLICASNDNNILTDFFNTGTYDKKRKFVTTISPAMDILVSSNLERLLYDVSGEDDAIVSRCMTSLKENGLYSVDKRTINSMNNFMWASYSTEEETKETIKNVYEKYNYLIDPHTAVGINVYDKYVISTGDMTKTICVSTASPFKFGKTVAESLYGSDVVKGLMRREILYSIAHLGIVRRELLRMMSWKVGLETHFSLSVGKNYKYLKRYVSDGLWNRLMTTYRMDTYENYWNSLFTCLDLFREVSKEVAVKLCFEYPDNDFNLTKYVIDMYKGYE